MDIPHVAVHSCAVVIILCANIVSAIEVGFHAVQIPFLVVSLRLHLLLILRHSDQWAVLHTRNATSREHSVATQQLLVLMMIVLMLMMMSILGALIC